jgi:hypothetical protein
MTNLIKAQKDDLLADLEYMEELHLSAVECTQGYRHQADGTTYN